MAKSCRRCGRTFLSAAEESTKFPGHCVIRFVLDAESCEDVERETREHRKRGVVPLPSTAWRACFERGCEEVPLVGQSRCVRHLVERGYAI